MEKDIAKNYTLRCYRPEDAPHIIELMASKSSNPEKYRAKKTKIWHWQYHQNPHNPEPLPLMYVIEIDDKIVASMSLVETKILAHGQEECLLFGMDFIVSSSFRRSGIGGLLIKAVQKNYRCIKAGLNLSESSTNLLVNKLGWRAPTPVHELFFIARPRHLSPKEIRKTCFSRWHFSRNRKISRGIETQQLASLPPDYDLLWEETAKELNCAVFRDSVYLTWKYFQHPLFQYFCFTATVAGRTAGMLIGRIAENRQEKIGIITEIIVPPSKTDITIALIRAATTMFRDNGVSLIRCVTSQSSYVDTLKKVGYFSFDHPPIFILEQPFGPLHDARYYHDQWFLSGGDSDNDISAEY